LLIMELMSGHTVCVPTGGKIMSNQSFGRESSGEISGKNKATEGDDTLTQASRVARGVADKAQKVVSNTASTITDHVKGLLDDQVGNGADIMGHFANSAKRAADDLDPSAPQLASLVRGVADRLGNYADDLHDQSVDQLLRAASNYTRRQPAVVFGLAALVGFFALRTFKSTSSSNASDSEAPGQRIQGSRLPRVGGFYGS
jgi:ElaB/YqjD/DUF883 family membrane-anchored ribosome-binding protein